jgi:hypothetical protein
MTKKKKKKKKKFIYILSQDWFDEQESWWQAQVSANPGDGQWRQMGMLWLQYQGLAAGYTQRATEPGSGLPLLPRFAFQLLNGCGDLFDVLPSLNVSTAFTRADLKRMTSREVVEWDAERGMCSALIKVTPDNSDVFFGHSAWFLYSSMNRIFKSYEFAVSDPATVGRALSFSSYSGFLVSLDDFYPSSTQKLAMVQTTNNIFDNALFQRVTPKTLLAWQRVRLAFAVADSGAAWHKAFSFHASGTYTNSYMVLDFKLFTPGQPLPANFLWVVEEIPGLMVGEDLTKTLDSGYYPSYNKPFFKQIYDASGYPAAVEKAGPTMSYELCPRAEIFRRDQGKVTDLESFKALLRQNDYLTDPLSRYEGEQNPMFAICSRGDLKKPKPTMGGCYDTKVSSYSMLGRSQIINGPTTAGHTLPPFRWTSELSALAPHAGLPELMNFTFIELEN